MRPSKLGLAISTRNNTMFFFLSLYFSFVSRFAQEYRLFFFIICQQPNQCKWVALELRENKSDVIHSMLMLNICKYISAYKDIYMCKRR